MVRQYIAYALSQAWFSARTQVLIVDESKHASTSLAHSSPLARQRARRGMDSEDGWQTAMRGVHRKHEVVIRIEEGHLRAAMVAFVRIMTGTRAVLCPSGADRVSVHGTNAGDSNHSTTPQDYATQIRS